MRRSTPGPAGAPRLAMSDAALVRFATEFRAGILNGESAQWMCFAVCAPLQSLLRLYGVESELVEGDLGACNHYWLRLSDGRVLDPTADQFNHWNGVAALPPVYLGPPTDCHRNPVGKGEWRAVS